MYLKLILIFTSSDRMNEHFIQVCCWLALLLPVSLQGQMSIVDEYVSEALANNLNLRSYQLSAAKQQSRVEQAKRLWQPNMDVNASCLFAEGGRTIVFPVGDLSNPVYGTLNRLTATQSFPEDLENFTTHTGN